MYQMKTLLHHKSRESGQVLEKTALKGGPGWAESCRAGWAVAGTSAGTVCRCPGGGPTWAQLPVGSGSVLEAEWRGKGDDCSPTQDSLLLSAGPGNLLPGDSWGSGCREDEGNRSEERNLGADPRGRDTCFSPKPQTLAAWATLSPSTGSGPCSGCCSWDTNVQGSPGPRSGQSSRLLPAPKPGCRRLPSVSGQPPSGRCMHVGFHSTQPSGLAPYTQPNVCSPTHVVAVSIRVPFASNLRLYHHLFIFSLADGYYRLAVENSVIVNTCVHVFGHLFSIRLVHTSEQNR